MTTQPTKQKTYFAFDKAQRVAAHIYQLLEPHCEKIHLAGSIRRLELQVSDIEIVCIPKKEEKKVGLFPEDTALVTDRNFVEAFMTITKEIKYGNVEGRMMKIITTSQTCPGIELDLFMPQPGDYYRQYAIRTGSAEYSHHILAGAWSRKGWVGAKNIGLRKRGECIGSNEKGWTLNPAIKNPTLPPVWKTEGEFFTWLGLAYIDPEHRKYNQQQNQTR
jgi:DNA polymerase/3'-5' exonuclease PolX